MLLLALFAGACSGDDRTSTEFCEKLGEITGPTGAESIFVPGDPDRIDRLVGELAALHNRAPDDISATTRTLLNFFQSYQQAARDERRDVIADNEQQLAQASANLDSYALTECGLFLQRVVPTPLPTVNPIVQDPTE